MAKPSVPLGDLNGGHWHGPNLHKLPAHGNAASQMLQRSLMQKTGDHFVSDVTGNFKSILASREVCNDIMTVFIGDDASIVYAAIGQAFNISLSHAMNAKRLFDQIMIVVSRPAPIALKNTRPTTSAAFWLERDFTKSTRQTVMTFPGEVVNAVETLKSRLASFDPLGGSNPEDIENNLIIQEKFDKLTEEILSSLSECFAAPAFTMKKSFEQGVIDQALMALIETSIPYALCEVIQRFTTSIAEGSTPGDWESNYQLQKTLSKEYAKKSCETAFMLSKCQETFLPRLIDTGIAMVKKIAYMPSSSVIYESVTDTLFELGGTIHFSNRAFHHVTTHPYISKNQLKSGYLIDRKPAFYKPHSSFMENDPTKSVVMLYDDEQHQRDKTALEEIVKTAREKHSFPTGRTQGQGVVSLSDLGMKIIAGEKLTEGESRRSTRSRYQLGSYDVNQPCLFVVHRGKAYIVDYSREYMPLGDQPDYYGRSPSLVSLKHNIFRVTLGDVDEKHPYLDKWISNTVGSGEKPIITDIQPDKAFSIKPVTMHTPGLSPQRLTFGSNELKTALMDPALFDATKQEQAMNDNLLELDQRRETDLQFMKNLYRYKLKLAEGADELTEKYFQNRTATGDIHGEGQTALLGLRQLQLHPFFDVRHQAANGTNKFSFKKRDIYLQIPPYEMPLHIVKQRGLFLLAKGARGGEIAKVNQKLCDLIGTHDPIYYMRYVVNNDNPESDHLKTLRSIADSLSSMFKKVFERASLTADKVNFVFEKYTKTGNEEEAAFPYWFITKYVLIPIITRGHVVFSNAAGTNKSTKKLVGDKAEVPLGISHYTMFDADQIFKKQIVMSANTQLIVNKKNWAPILQAAALIMQYCYTTPSALSAVVAEDCHPGFAVDFLRHEAIYSEQAIFTTVGSHEMILSPGGVTENEKGDGSIELLVRGDIHTTSNTLGAGAVLVPSVFPNENGIPRGQTANEKPIITRDGITRTDYGTVNVALEKIKTLGDDEKKTIKDQLNISTRPRKVYSEAIGGGVPKYPDEFVPIIRPVGRPTEEVRSVMGVEMGACMPLVGSKNSTWEQFYTSREPTNNPYASEMGGLYPSRYIKNNTAILKGSRCFLLKTTNAHQLELPCATTAVLEQLYDMSCTLGVLTAHEKSAITMNAAGNFDSVGGMTFKTILDDPDVNGRPLLGTLDVPAALGLSVPYTQTTDARQLDETHTASYAPSGFTKTLNGPNEFYIESPFTAPPKRCI